MINNATMHHTRAELQGTVEFLFSEDAISLADARLKGYLNYGNFLGFELKADPKRTPKLAAARGIVFENGSTGAGVSLGVELSTKEVADMRKAKILLMAKDAAPFTQAAIANAAIETLAFTAQIPAKLNYDYPLTVAGVQVRHLTAVTLALTAGAVPVLGVDFTVDLELGFIRFINPATLPANTITPTVSAPAIDSAHDKYMEGVTPMAQPTRNGWGRIIVWDSDLKNRMVKDFEPRPMEIYTSGGITVNHENQAEHKITAMFRSITERMLLRP